MGFINTVNNDEHKLRISLSTRALITITEDMSVFGVTSVSNFINTVFANFYSDAKSSISLQLEQLRLELERRLTEEEKQIKKEIARDAIEWIIKLEENKLIKFKNDRLHNDEKKSGKLYYISKENLHYLIDECNEEEYYDRPGLYFRAVLEEYCSLPFVERVRIYKKDVYDIIEQAINESRQLKVNINSNESPQSFIVYPYTIMSDPLNSQSYLVCYSMKTGQSDRDKIVASFSMTRLNMPVMTRKTFHLNKQEISNIKSQLEKNSPAYLIGKPEQIKVKLTKKGKVFYQSRLHSRPEKIEDLSSENIYIFDCTQQQAFNYFFSFGADAEIIKPKELRERFKKTYESALKKYSSQSES